MSSIAHAHPSTFGVPGAGRTASVTVGTGALAIDEVVAVARHGASVALDPTALDGVAASREIIEGLAADPEPHYGISTGFGALATTFIAEDRRAQLQASLVRSHAAGSGSEVEREVVRALMLLRLSTLMTGRTGVRRETAETYAAILNAGITPVVREYGSLGCSGDLAPLAHCALAAMGEGEVRVAPVGRVAPAEPSRIETEAAGLDTPPAAATRPPVVHAAPAGRVAQAGPSRIETEAAGLDTPPAGATRPPVVPAADALADAGITPLRLGEKEGLALINGTDGMLGMLALAIDDLRVLLTTADVAAAMSVEGLMGTDAVFAEDLHALRPQRGQAASASNLRRLLADSPIVASHKGPECTRVQDAYSLRCAPQVHGAARDTLAHATSVAEAELASAIDNPVLTLDCRVESNGNFHGAPVGYVLDFLAIAVADVASMSERRTDRFLDRARNQGLPPFLAHEVGVDSGLMIAQYTAAGIVSELKRLAVPASVDSIPSSAMQEDHVSMGWAAARKLRRAIDGLTRVLAIEIMTAGRGLRLRAPLEPGPATGEVVSLVAGVGAVPGADRFLTPEIEAITELVGSGQVIARAGRAVGVLE
ncbi:histidine ammonia-lyase [Agromyces sp. Marseille-P2726]|uniref:histidine ammonia-lyase n=1 Tax=Agromyces sp. Marseille-P2726 TaxID=2709132 RepID=UPI00156DBEDE|nr:histidine ammonia-lyase [Agromyces sp. Marseille-P2726]